MDVTSHLVTQAIFRLCFAACLALGMVPAGLALRGFSRGTLAGVFLAGALAAALIYAAEHGSGAERLLMGLALCLAAAGGVAAVAWPQRVSSRSSYLIFVVGLIAFLASLSSARWDTGTTGLGLSLAVFDLACGGLLLAAILAAVLLPVWHLGTPKMSEVPLDRIARLLTLAVATRCLLTVVALAAQMFQGEATMLAGVFLVSRCILPGLGLWMLVLLRREVGEEPQEMRTSGTLLLGLFVALLGELGTHLVPLDGLYPL